MKSIAVCMHVEPATAAVLTNDRADVAGRGAILARLWRYGSCHDWRPAPPTDKTWGDLQPVAVVCLFYDAEAAALLGARPEELRPMLRAIPPTGWQFITTVDPVGRPAVALHGVPVAEVERSEESYHRAAVHARLDAGAWTFASAN